MKALEPLLGILLGVGILILSHFFKDLQPTLLTVGGALLTSGMPQVSQLMKPNRAPSDAGHATPTIFFLLAFAALATFVGIGVARADAAVGAPVPGTLGCSANGIACARVILPAGLGGLNLKTRSVEGGAFPTGGVGLGVDLWPKTWHTVSPGVAVAASAASGAANYANIAGVVGVFRYFWIGTMVHVTPAFEQWYLLAGIDPMALVAALGP